ncbi:permease [Bacillus sp. RG28]|uniref:Permease n=1 Tax=Gottfriedia endophytica TaxID=2820819 RepID=A0A940NTV2_9BACI|nr:permease [Gottfriedia endophytica]MBP0726671.1 permease [Gottfriedia endophytica]
MKSTKNIFIYLFGYLIGILFLSLIIFMGKSFISLIIDFFTKGSFASFSSHIPKSVNNLITIFISILLEAFPFVLLGVFVSSLIQMYVSEEKLKKFIPKNPILAIIATAFLCVLFPVCECTIVPVVRRLIKKGMPLHLGIVLLVGAPIINPIVFLSTYVAFRMNVQIAYERMGLAFIVIVFIGLLIYLLFENTDQLKWVREDLESTTKVGASNPKKSLKSVLYHASDEFFQMGKYLIFGAFIASLFQTFFNRSYLVDLGSNNVSGPPVMMGFAYALSLCSEADAFVGASFLHTFSTGSILAFLLFGPMVDFKNTIMLFGYFKPKFVITFMFITALVVLGVIEIYQIIVLG